MKGPFVHHLYSFAVVSIIQQRIGSQSHIEQLAPSQPSFSVILIPGLPMIKKKISATIGVTASGFNGLGLGEMAQA